MMIKNKILRFGFLAAVMVMMAVGVFALNVHVHAAAPSILSTQVAIVHHKTTGYVYAHTSLNVKVNTPFTFVNLSNATQTVTSNGQNVVTILKGASAPYTFTSPGTFTFGLASNALATLTVTAK